MLATETKIPLLPTALDFSTQSPFHAGTDFTAINDYFEERPLDGLLQWSLATFGDKVAQVTSFGPTGMVILDRLAQLSPGIRIVTIDTNFLFEETYALWEEVQRRYPITLEIRRPQLSPEAQAQQYGAELWAREPDQCCAIRKVVATREVLAGLDAWLTGLRRDQAATRNQLSLVGWDRKYNLVKINPLANWTRGQVWKYILEHKVPYNPLHDQGYASIGCTHCTRPVDDPNNERSGRWQGLQKIECGIHI